MPTYEYRCQSCDHQFEIFARMSDPDPEDCPDCNATGSLQKVLFPVAVHYKGSGFYSTDYAGKKTSATASTDGGSSDSSSSSDSSGASSDAGAATSSSGSDSGTSSSSTAAPAPSAPSKAD